MGGERAMDERGRHAVAQQQVECQEGGPDGKAQPHPPDCNEPTWETTWEKTWWEAVKAEEVKCQSESAI